MEQTKTTTIEDSRIIDFHFLSIEIRRLKNSKQAISLTALLINRSIIINNKQKPIDYSTFIRHRDSQTLYNLCKIIIYRFCRNPSKDIQTLIMMTRFSPDSPYSMIGPQFLLTTLLSVHQSSMDEESLECLFRYNPDFFQSYLLGHVYSNPASICQSSETILPLQIPVLRGSSFPDDKYKNYSIFRFLIQFTISKSFEHICECSSNESLFDAFAGFVYKCPQFFFMANQIFPSKNELKEILVKLKKKNSSALICSFISAFNQASNDLSLLFFEIYSENELVSLVSDGNATAFCEFLKKFEKWNIIQILYKKKQNFVIPMLTKYYKQDERSYLENYSKLNYDYLIEAVEPFIRNGQIEPSNHIYLLNSKNLVLEILNYNPNFLTDILRSFCKVRNNQVNNNVFDNVQKVIRFVRENNKILDIDNLFSQESIVMIVYNINRTLFFDLFSNQNLLERATVSLINLFFQDAAKIESFPSINFFRAMAKKVEKKVFSRILIKIYEEHFEILNDRRWTDIIIRIPEFLFFTLLQVGKIRAHDHRNNQSNRDNNRVNTNRGSNQNNFNNNDGEGNNINVNNNMGNAIVIGGVTEVYSMQIDDSRFLSLLYSYISLNFDTLSNDTRKFQEIVAFFIGQPPKQLAFANLSISVQLSLLEIFANCSRCIFPNHINYSNYSQLDDCDLDSCDLIMNDNSNNCIVISNTNNDNNNNNSYNNNFNNNCNNNKNENDDFNNNNNNNNNINDNENGNSFDNENGNAFDNENGNAFNNENGNAIGNFNENNKNILYNENYNDNGFGVHHIQEFIDFFLLMAKNDLFSKATSATLQMLHEHFILPLINHHIDDRLIGELEVYLNPSSSGGNNFWIKENEIDFINYTPKLDVQLPCQICPENVDLLVKYVVKSMPDESQISNIPISLQIELAALTMKVFSLPMSPLWDNVQFMRCLVVMLETLMDKIIISPRFVQCVAYLLFSGETNSERRNEENSEELNQCYQMLASALRNNLTFCSALEELL